MDFYVYDLVDPRSGLTFYVGKGRGARIDAHEIEAAKGVRSRKCDRIREIQAVGSAVEKRHIAYFVGEQDAYDFETERIAEIGLHNLTNVLPGGQKAWADRQAVVAARAAERERLRKVAKHRATRDYLRKWLAMVDSWKWGVTFPGMKDGDAKAEELVAHVRWTLSRPEPA